MCYPTIDTSPFNPADYPTPEVPSTNPVLMLNKKAMGYDQIILKMNKRKPVPVSPKNSKTSGLNLPPIV